MNQQDTASPKLRKPYVITRARERWTDEEHGMFLEALKLYGRTWRKIEEHIGTKTAVQIRSHAQKFFDKVGKGHKEAATAVTAAAAAAQAMAEGDIDIPPPRTKRKNSQLYPKKSDYNGDMNSGGTNSLEDNDGWHQGGSCDFQPDLQQPSINTGGAMPLTSVPLFYSQLPTHQAPPSMPISFQQLARGASLGFGMSGPSAGDGGASSMLLMGGGMNGSAGRASSGQVSEVTVAAVAAAASAAAAAAAAAVVAAAGHQVQAFLKIHPPPGFPFFGISPDLLAQLTLQNQLQATDPNTLLRTQSRRGHTDSKINQHPSASARFQIKTMEGAANLLGALTEATATTTGGAEYGGADKADPSGEDGSRDLDENPPSKEGNLAERDGNSSDGACSRETDLNKNGPGRGEEDMLEEGNNNNNKPRPPRIPSNLSNDGNDKTATSDGGGNGGGWGSKQPRHPQQHHLNPVPRSSTLLRSDRLKDQDGGSHGTSSPTSEEGEGVKGGNRGSGEAQGSNPGSNSNDGNGSSGNEEGLVNANGSNSNGNNGSNSNDNHASNSNGDNDRNRSSGDGNGSSGNNQQGQSIKDSNGHSSANNGSHLPGSRGLSGTGAFQPISKPYAVHHSQISLQQRQASGGGGLAGGGQAGANNNTSHGGNPQHPVPSDQKQQLHQQVLQQLQILSGSSNSQQQQSGQVMPPPSQVTSVGHTLITSTLLDNGSTPQDEEAGTLKAVLAALNAQSVLMAPYLRALHHQHQPSFHHHHHHLPYGSSAAAQAQAQAQAPDFLQLGSALHLPPDAMYMRQQDLLAQLLTHPHLLGLASPNAPVMESLPTALQTGGVMEPQYQFMAHHEDARRMGLNGNGSKRLNQGAGEDPAAKRFK